MVTSSQIYWLLMLDGIKMLFLVGGLLLFILTVAIIGALISDSFDTGKKIHPTGYLFVFLFLVLAGSGVFIPTTKQMAVIMVAPKVINNEQVQKLPNQVLELANEWLEGLKPKGETK